MTGICTCAMAPRCARCCRFTAAALRARDRHAESASRRSRRPSSPSPTAQRILAALPAGSRFEPLMTLYLTDRTAPAEVDARQGERHRARLQALPGRRHDSLRRRRHRHPQRIDAVLERMGELGVVAAGARRGHRRRGRRLRSRGALHRRRARAARARAFPSCASCSSTSPRAMPWISCAARAPASRATITPQHLLMNRNALFAGGIRRTTTACRCSRPSRIASRCSRQPPAAIRVSSSARTARRMRATRRKRPAAARASSPRMPPSSCMPKSSKRRARWRGSRVSPVEFGADFYGLPRNAERITLVKCRWARAARSYPFDRRRAGAAARRRDVLRWRHETGLRMNTPEPSAALPPDPAPTAR